MSQSRVEPINDRMAGAKRKRRRSGSKASTGISLQEAVIALRSTNGIITEASKKLGVSRTTLHRFIRANPPLIDLQEEVEEETIDLAEYELVQAIREGKEKSIHFFLRTKGRRRGYVTATEHSGPDGGAIPMDNRPDFDSMTDEQLEAYIAWQESLKPKRSA